ncbi:hypothetical protein D3C83_261690 [compost metagenome]
MATQLSSDMPHTSAIGTPIAWKNSSTSSGVGAAPTKYDRVSANPSFSRSGANIIASARATPSASGAGTG